MHIYERGYQLGMGLGMKVMPTSKQELITGPGSLDRIPELLNKRGLSRPLIVTGPRVSRTSFFQRLVGLLEQTGEETPVQPAGTEGRFGEGDDDSPGICVTVFSEVEPDPSTDLVHRVMEAYRAGDCDCFIALGGGSNMDAAKAAAAGLTRPEKELAELGGVMKVRRKTPFMIAVPTTAGTGSECTVAAVVTDSETHRKFAINDPVLCPDTAVLDADLTATLPSAVVAATGMDALTHAVEAYLNRAYHKPRTKAQCVTAVHDIMQYLPFVYVDALETVDLSDRRLPSPRARQKMLEASYRAGQAFTTACVGNVHAIAHTLGGLYHIPHGEANAVLLPEILEDYGRKVWKPLARLARDAELEYLLQAEERSDEHLARVFIDRIRQMNREMGLPEAFPQIREEDLDQMAEWAISEANPLYPVPVIYGTEDVKRILRQVSTL